MRGIIGYLGVVLLAAAAPADDVGTAHKYKLADLPNPVTATSADVIVVVEEVRPADAKEFRATSDNPDVRVRAVALDGKLCVLITGDKAGTATVGWTFKVKGAASGYKGLKVEIK
jgi:hypothetical protein